MNALALRSRGPVGLRGRENNVARVNAYSFCSRYLTTLTVRGWHLGHSKVRLS